MDGKEYLAVVACSEKFRALDDKHQVLAMEIAKALDGYSFCILASTRTASGMVYWVGMPNGVAVKLEFSDNDIDEIKAIDAVRINDIPVHLVNAKKFSVLLPDTNERYSFTVELDALQTLGGLTVYAAYDPSRHIWYVYEENCRRVFA